MRIAIYLFNGMTSLDAVGPFDLLNRIPGAVMAAVGDGPGPKEAQGGLALIASHDLAEIDKPDVILIPGGGPTGLAAEAQNSRLLGWLSANHPVASWTASVCTGALLLGAGGLLENRRAITHWRARDYLATFGARYVDERVVEDGKIITGAGVTAGLDLALALTDRLAGRQVAEAVQLSAHYDPAPPFPPQHHASASADLLRIIENDLGPPP